MKRMAEAPTDLQLFTDEIYSALKLNDAGFLAFLQKGLEQRPEIFTAWRDGKHKGSLLHLVAGRNKMGATRFLVEKGFKVNEQRPGDGCSPLHLAAWSKHDEMMALLVELGADPGLTNKYGEVPDQTLFKSMKAHNLIWLDLELTDLENPEILECAVIITDKELNEIARADWVIHFDKSDMEKLSDWHQTHFKCMLVSSKD